MGKFFSWLKSLFTSNKLPVDVPAPIPVVVQPIPIPKGWSEEYDKAILAEARDLVLPPVPCGSITKFLYAIAVAESGLDAKQVYHEPAPLNNNSIGLLQLSLSDVRNYHADDLGIHSEEDLKDPIKNLRLGMRILASLHKQMPDKTVWETGGRYWSTLRCARYWPTRNQDGFNRFKKALGCADLEDVKPPVSPPNDKPEPTAVKRMILADAYMAKLKSFTGLRETNGKNREPRIDAFNKYTGAGNGAPYCIGGALWCLNEVCKELGYKNPVPAQASTQSFFNDAPFKYKVALNNIWLVGDIGIMVSKTDSSHGHAFVVRRLKLAPDSEVRTCEFNTGPDSGRDGDGYYEKVRDMDGTSGLKMRGAVDVFQWILDANK